MQTFLPYPDFIQSARSLDRMRLGKQRVEAKQVHLALTTPNYGWRHHPAVRMWEGHVDLLVRYGVAVCGVWRSRGYRDTLLDYFMSAPVVGDGHIDPPWLGDEAFHISHQSNLIRKLPSHYAPQFPNVPDNLPYLWPASI